MSDLHETAREAVRLLRRAGHAAWWVGGAVRDHLMHREPAEYDLATDATPEVVEALCRTRGLPALTVGKAFGVVRFELAGHWFEAATLRAEGGYSDHRRPSEVVYTRDPRLDAQRRDFTVNAMYMEPDSGEILDFVAGRCDIERRLLRAVGNAGERFAEDHLRKLRLARFCAQLQFEADPAALAAIAAHPALAVSAERINQEFSRLLLTGEPERGLRLLASTGLLDEFLPEVSRMRRTPQPVEFHPEGDVFEHTLLMFRAAARPMQDLVLALALLLHDVGKPVCIEEPEGRLRFPRHDAVGAGIAGDALARLRYPNDVRDAVVELVRQHMRIKDAPRMRKSRLLRLLSEPLFPRHLELHRLDCLASHGNLQVHEFLKQQHAEWRQQPQLPPAFINGHDVLALGVPKGPKVGRILRAVYDAQLDGAVADREAALALARRLAAYDAP